MTEKEVKRLTEIEGRQVLRATTGVQTLHVPLNPEVPSWNYFRTSFPEPRRRRKRRRQRAGPVDAIVLWNCTGSRLGLLW